MGIVPLKKANMDLYIHVCVVSSFPPSHGPLSEYTLSLVNAFSFNPMISKITVIGDEVNKSETYSNRKVRIARSWKLNSLLNMIKITRAVLKSRPDVVYFNLVYRHFSSNRLKNFVGLLTPLVLKMLGFPVMITLHSIGEAFDISDVGYKDSLLNKTGIRLATKALLCANVVTLTHNHFVKILKEKYSAKNVTFVPHGIFGAPLQSCNLKGNRLLVFGKIGPYKNLDLVLDAYQEIVPINQNSELIVAGSAHPLHQGYLERIKKDYAMVPNVRYTGYVSEDEIAETFMRASIVILPYTSSVWSSGVFALCSMYGRAVIASDLPDFKVLKEEGAGVLLFRNRSKKDLSDKIAALLHDKAMQYKMGQLNLSWANKNTFEQTAERILYLLFETLRRNKHLSRGNI